MFIQCVCVMSVFFHALRTFQNTWKKVFTQNCWAISKEFQDQWCAVRTERNKGGRKCRDETAGVGCDYSMMGSAAQEEENTLFLFIYFCHCFLVYISSVHPFLITPSTSLFAHPAEFRLVSSVSLSLIKSWSFCQVE